MAGRGMYRLPARRPVNERYEPVELPRDDRKRRRWGIRDSSTGRLIEDDGEALVFYTRRSADNWIYSQISLDNAGVGRA